VKIYAKVICIALLIAMAAFPVFAGGQQAGGAASSGGNVLKIGAFEPLTGANAGGGAIELEGIQLANKLYPTVNIGSTEYPVQLVVADNKSDKVEAANAVQRLVDSDKVDVVLGSWGSSFSIAAGPIVSDANVPAIGLSCTNPLVTLGNDWYFRVCFIDPFQGTVMAKYAYNNDKARKVSIVQEVSNDYSVGLVKFFTNEFTKLGGTVLSTVNYNTGDQDFTAQLTTIKGENPDVVFAPGNFTESAMVIQQARQMGITAPFLGTDTWETPEFLTVGGKAVEGATFSTFFDVSSAKEGVAKAFVDAYHKNHANDHDPNKREPAADTALGFDGYRLAIDAIHRAGSLDEQKIRDALAATKDFSGAAGSITLDENGDAVKPAYIKTVKDGKFVFETIVEPDKPNK
jgi:branched-chain amino acid transport system substrate-binding protein